MKTSLEYKVAVVTGGTSGIGKAADQALATAVAKVVVTGRRETEEKAVVQTIERPGGKPTTGSQVLAAAVDAHLVVFASCHPESLPFWAYEWLERWAVSRRVADAALALTDGGCETELTDAGSELSHLAGKHQLILIVIENSTVVTASTLNQLVEISKRFTKWIIASAYSEPVGVPALFARVTFIELRNLPLDRGAKQLIANRDHHVVAMSTPEAGRDIDAPEEYRELNEASYANPKKP